jgi:hypothetical protein
MKRSWIKRGKIKPMKRGRLHKESKQPISKLQRDIWELCRQIATILYPSDCFTCPQKGLVGSNRQLGHLWAKASLGANLKYDIRILRWQCMTCNCHQGGRGADFYARMLKENGQEYMDKLQQERQKTVKAYDFYVNLKSSYQEILRDLQKK